MLPNLPRDRAYGWPDKSAAPMSSAVTVPVTSAKVRPGRPAAGSVLVIPQDCAVWRAMAVASASVAPSVTMPGLRVGAVAGGVGGGVGAPVGLAEVDAVLDAGDLAPVGQPVAAERGVVQAVMGIGANQVQRGGLRRGRDLAGEVAEHGDGGIHLDVPVALGGVVEPAVAASRAGPGHRTGAGPDALQRQQRADAELLIAGSHRREFW